MGNGNKVYDYITDSIIEQLSKKNLSWLKDWSLGFGCNYITRKPYSGINALLINISLTNKGYKNNEWLTFKQIQSLGAKLNKGAKATHIIFFQIKESCSCKKSGCQMWRNKLLSDELKLKHYRKAVPILRYYNVFNIDDTDLESKAEKKVVLPIKEVENVLSNYWDLTKITLGNPSYNPERDSIAMPDLADFKEREGYYGALTHELVHSTGHKTRLNRKGITEVSIGRDSTYAYEELVAELGSAFLCATLGIEKSIENTSAYIQSWLKALKNDNTFIFKASAEARKGQEYITEYEKDATTEEPIKIQLEV